MSNKLKILCMHGYGTNKQFMQMQGQTIQRQLQKIAQFIYIDAPFIVPVESVFDTNVFKHLSGHPRSWFGSKLNKTASRSQILSSLEYIRLAIQSVSVNFDGVLGFSQGSMAFQIICLYHKLGDIEWQSFKNIKFFMNFSSVAARYTLSNVDWQAFQIPSIHILSSQDVFFQTMMTTLTRFKHPQQIYHSFGHKLPPLGVNQKKKIITFMKKYGLDSKGNNISFKSRL